MERLDPVSAAVLIRGIRSPGCQAYLERYFLLSAAPVLAGVKLSALICIRHC
ncbi:MAG: hypothetical protein ACOX88_02055 [Christensenellales bacterium]